METFFQALILHLIKHQKPKTRKQITRTTKHESKKWRVGLDEDEPVVAFIEAAEPDDVVVVEAGEQLQLPVEGALLMLLSPMFPVRTAHHGGDAVGEAEESPLSMRSRC